MDAHLSVAAESRDRPSLGLALIPVVARVTHCHLKTKREENCHIFAESGFF